MIPTENPRAVDFINNIQKLTLEEIRLVDVLIRTLLDERVTTKTRPIEQTTLGDLFNGN